MTDRRITPRTRTYSWTGAIIVSLLLAACAPASSAAPPASSAETSTSSAAPPASSASPSAASSPPIAVGGNHVCALPGDGTVKCWGYDYSGELGDGTQTDAHAPAGDSFPLVPVTVIAGPGSTSALTGVSAITAGYEHTCALLTDGSVKCWGANSASGMGRNGGQVGDGTTIDRLAPVTVIAGPGNSSPLSSVSAIAAGDLYTCALLADGTVKCWGDAPQGSSSAPVTVTTGPGNSSPLSGVTAIAAGDYHTCALLSRGTVTCWGSNGAGELGNGSTTSSVAPVAVVAGPGDSTPLSGVTAIAIEHGVPLEEGAASFGYPHTCALLTDGSVKCWGSNAVGQLGDGTSGGPQGHSAAPVSAIAAVGSTSTLTGVSAIAAGSEHACALLVAGTVKCWGQSWGLSPGAQNDFVAAPATVMATPGGTSALSGVTSIAAGDSQTCAVLDDGSVTCWAGLPEILVTISGLLVANP